MQRTVPRWHGTCFSAAQALACAAQKPVRTRACPATAGVESIYLKALGTTATMPRKNLLSLFADFTRFGGDVAVVEKRGYRREKLTYAELYSHVLFWSHALAGRGISPGDRVLLWGPNSAGRSEERRVGKECRYRWLP